MIWIGQYRETHKDSSLPSIFRAVQNEPPADKSIILRYLKSGIVSAISPGHLTDVIKGDGTIISNITCLHDCEFAWRSDLIYYFENYNLLLPPDFIAHIHSKTKPRQYKYTYTIAKSYDRQAFFALQDALTVGLPSFMKKYRLLEDVDGTLIQVYKAGNVVVKAFCDYEIDAVFVDSDINLNEILRFQLRKLR